MIRLRPWKPNTLFLYQASNKLWMCGVDAAANGYVNRRVEAVTPSTVQNKRKQQTLFMERVGAEACVGA